jgi:hypothetical protein
MKICTKCKVEKSIDEFFFTGSKKQTVRAWCKACVANSIVGHYRRERDADPKRGWARASHKSSAQRARDKSYEHELTIDNIYERCPDNCPVFGFPLNYSNTTLRFDSPTLDRIDNSKGYTVDNIQVISRRANSMKGDGTIEDVEKLLKFMKSL